MEILVSLSDKEVIGMLSALQEQVKKGGESAIVEFGEVSFQIHKTDSEYLKKFRAIHDGS